MSIFRTQDNVPDVYVNGSRDFQLLGRLLDANVNDIKYSIDGILMSIDSWTCPSNILPLLLTKLGFFTEYTFEDSVLRQVLQAFPYLMKYKGSKKAIYEAIFLFLRINKLKIPFEIDIVNKGTLGLNYTIIISFSSNPFKTTLLDEVFKYILPTGYIIRYVFTAEGHVPKEPEPLAYAKDFVEGFIVGNAVNNQLRSTSFDEQYVDSDPVFNDLLSGADTAVTGLITSQPSADEDDKDTGPSKINNENELEE